jgi:hypothetical protein
MLASGTYIYTAAVSAMPLPMLLPSEQASGYEGNYNLARVVVKVAANPGRIDPATLFGTGSKVRYSTYSTLVGKNQ